MEEERKGKKKRKEKFLYMHGKRGGSSFNSACKSMDFERRFDITALEKTFKNKKKKRDKERVLER